MEKNLLSERRNTEEDIYAELSDNIRSFCPELSVRVCDTLPEEFADVNLVLRYRSQDRFEEWLGTAPADCTVIVVQELCHQVSAVIRVK